MIKLFHGTTEAAAEAIRAAGHIAGPVFLTPRREIAENYGDEVIAVRVPETALLIDLDMPGAALVSVETANGYTGNDWTLADYIDAGHSVGVLHSVRI